MRFIHIADSHLGRVAFNKTTEDGSNLRETLIYDNFFAAINRVIDEQPEALIHAGDLFDTVKPKTKALLVVMQALDMLKDAEIPFIAVAGNHSMQKNAHTISAFEILKQAHPEIHVAYSFKYEDVQVGDTLFHLIPNMLHPEDYQIAADEAISHIRHWKPLKKNGYSGPTNHVLVTHGLASTIRDKRLSTVAEFELTPEVMSEEFDYIALGHYHGQMQVGQNAWYSGSTEHLTYGEIADKKGGLEVEIDNGITHVSHFSLPRSPMKDIGIIRCSDLSMEDIIDSIENEVGLIDGVGDQMFQITLDFDGNPVKAIPADALTDIRDSILDLKIRVRSKETERQQIQQQDLRTVNYVDEWDRFMGPSYPMNETMRAIVQQRGSETLKTVMQQHAEVTE
jgi:DNA repair exonuclease SbcCD nuclease subunit